jgi:pyrroline-5-carboxylate reductase
MRLAILGCGNMGRALAMRLSLEHCLFFYDQHSEKAKHLESEGYGEACLTLKEAISSAEIVMLVFKPQNLKETADLIQKELNKKQMVVSLLAGTSLSQLQNYFPDVLIFRMMPNLAVMYGAGIVGLSINKEMELGAKEQFAKIFETLGKVEWIGEDKMSAFTAISGSGPAFFFAMIEDMIESGKALGFSAKEAQDLIYQMVRGSLILLENSMQSPQELKMQVASPGGTTMAGLDKWEEHKLREGIMTTFLAAKERAEELSKNSY